MLLIVMLNGCNVVGPVALGYNLLIIDWDIKEMNRK